jgi:hypothetical protein
MCFRWILVSLAVAGCGNAAVDLQAHYVQIGPNDETVALAEDQNGNVFIGSFVFVGGGYECSITKADQNGNVLTSFQFALGNNCQLTNLAVDAQGNVFAVVWYTGSNAEITSGFVVKLDNQLTSVLAAATFDEASVSALLLDPN